MCRLALAIPCWLVAGVVVAAPVPVTPPPKLSDALIGKWQQDCMILHGVAEFRRDGTYEYIPDDPDHSVCRGRWWVDGSGDIRLHETCHRPDGSDVGPLDLTITVKYWDGAGLLGTWLGSGFSMKRLK